MMKQLLAVCFKESGKSLFVVLKLLNLVKQLTLIAQFATQNFLLELTDSFRVALL
jgi:hypothetical protein